jgi:hypothetical protein
MKHRVVWFTGIKFSEQPVDTILKVEDGGLGSQNTRCLGRDQNQSLPAGE